jgi:hypothetical protein
MALLPCDFGRHPFRLKSGMIYVGILDRPDPIRWKIRVCKEHGDVVQEGLGPYEVSQELLESNPSLMVSECPTCLQRVDTEFKPLYVTAYYPGQERRDYWARLHWGCSAPAWLPYTQASPQPV